MLLVKFLFALASVFRRAPVEHEQSPPYDAKPYGPQNWEEAIRASEALQGKEDDIRYIGEPSSAGIKDDTYRWPGYPGKATIPYYLTPEVENDQKLKGLIEDAIEHYKQKTCITFVERTNEPDYLRIFKDGRKCYSYVGKIESYWQPQNVSLGPGCEFIGTVVHELGHALGLYHEHQRSDRDNYITVYPNNVASGSMHNFNKTEASKEETFGADYDYGSIMHYGVCAFSKDSPGCKTDKSLRTMEAKDGTELKEPYDKDGLNEKDIELIKNLYKC